jgi:hypothetical protein
MAAARNTSKRSPDKLNADATRAQARGRKQVSAEAEAIRRLEPVGSRIEMCPGAHWPEMVGRLRALPDGELGPEHLMTDDFLLEEERRLQVYWLPFERLNPTARIAIVGLTPGWHQMQLAFTAAREAFHAGMTDDLLALEYIGRQAGFAGSLRVNMIKMLDAIGLPAALGVQTSAELFQQRDDLIHGTSALRYPVFVAGKNYGGANPRVERSAMLTRFVHEQLAAELAAIPDALVLPLGKAVEGCLRLLIAAGQLEEARCLFGFPHPSGANAHRADEFRRNEVTLRAEVARWSAEIVLPPAS